MSAPAALLLDAMGTLVRLRPPAPLLRTALAERYSVKVGEEQAARAFAQEIRFYRAHLQEGRDAQAVRELQAACARVLRTALGAAQGFAAIPEPDFCELMLDCLRFDPYPDAEPALADARARGSTVIVVSNWDASLHDVLVRTGLNDSIDHVLTSAEAGVRKPAPEIFRRALRLAGAGAGESLHVGDSVEEDVAGARAAGIPCALLARDGATTPAGVVAIEGLGELPDAWRRLSARD